MKYIKCFPNFKMKALTFSFDDGTNHDIETISILNKFNLKATFNLNSKLMYPNSKYQMDNWVNCYRLDKYQINEIYKGHEIASHSSTHTDFKDQSDESLAYELDEDIKELSKITNYQIKGFAYPFGIYSNKIIDRLKSLGIIYARATSTNHLFNIPKDFYTFGGTATISDSKLPSLIKKFNNMHPKTMKLFYIWGHSYEFDMFHIHELNYKNMEALANKNDVYYGTNIEIFSYLNALKKLRYSNKEKAFINNSDLDLYVIANNEKIIVNANSKKIFK